MSDDVHEVAPLSGRRVVITGARGGIGAAAATRLRGAGARVLGIDLEPVGDEVLAADVRDRDAVERAVAEASDRLGGLDVLINNAGIGRAHDAGDFPDEAARAIMDVNFFGAWTTTAAALPHLLDARGHVVNVASGLVFIDLPFATAYTASKRALMTYSAALRHEYRGRLTVTTVCPGYIRTSIHDEAARSGVSLEGLLRPDTVEGAGRAILHACVSKPTTISTSRASTVELWFARRMPRATATIVGARMKRWAKERPVPPFLRYPQESMWSGPPTG